MKNLSVYATGDRHSISFYRIWQYVDKLNNTKVIEHSMNAKFLLKRFYPIGTRPIHIKIFAWICMCLKVLWSLVSDLWKRPDLILVQREFVKKRTPKLFRFFINIHISRGAKIIWDIDDNILSMREINKSDFLYLAKKSSCILVTHDYLKSLIPEPYREKVFIVRTTDGDMYKSFKKNMQEITERRKNTLEKTINLIWVATSVNIPYLEAVTPFLDASAKKIQENSGRKLILNVVCNQPLKKRTQYLQIRNVQWTRERAVDEMKKSHIGIMPLLDSDIAKGKGGFKLVQYMSIGLPCIASDVGFNQVVVKENFGFLAKNEQDWTNAIAKLGNINFWESCSKNAFLHWNENFSFEKNLKFFQTTIDNL